jgi:hypothetical protein
MQKIKKRGIKLKLLLSAFLCSFLGVTTPANAVAESGCVTCHLDLEVLKQTVTEQKGKKSSLQSGAG